MAFGVNFLFRVGRKVLAEPLEDSGLLPGKYYRSQALQALEENDFPACLRYLKMAQVHRKAQARLVAQILILRCRMLQEEHSSRVSSLREVLRLESDPEMVRRYRQILAEEHKALHLLGSYIQAAQDLTTPPADVPKNPA